MDPCKELSKACVVAARLLKTTTEGPGFTPRTQESVEPIGFAGELIALELETVSTGPGFDPRTQASVEPVEGSQALWFAVLERRAISAPVSRLPASSLSTPAYSLQGRTRCPDGASSHWNDSVPGGNTGSRS